MPTHIYARVGDHDASARLNERAAAIDRQYVGRYHVQGIYPMMYFNHNLHFAAYSNACRGRYREAMRSARELYARAAPDVKEMPMVEMFTPTPLLIQVRFRRWDELLRAPDPGTAMPITRAAWRFGRGMAYAGRGDTA